MATSRRISEAGNLETDVVVIGGGGTGLAAAVSAAEAGMRVILLEKRHSPGGNSVFPDGLFAAESPGSAFGFAINSGRIAGENASKYVTGAKKKKAC